MSFHFYYLVSKKAVFFIISYWGFLVVNCIWMYQNNVKRYVKMLVCRRPSSNCSHTLFMSTTLFLDTLVNAMVVDSMRKYLMMLCIKTHSKAPVFLDKFSAGAMDEMLLYFLVCIFMHLCLSCLTNVI